MRWSNCLEQIQWAKNNNTAADKAAAKAKAVAKSWGTAAAKAKAKPKAKAKAKSPDSVSLLSASEDCLCNIRTCLDVHES